MEMINLTINGQEIEVPVGTTVLEAARMIDVYIPTLCHLDLCGVGVKNDVASCRVCIVEVEGAPAHVTACSTRVTPGMVVNTNTPKIIADRRNIVELILSNHPAECLICPKNLDCDLQRLAAEVGAHNVLKYDGEKSNLEKDVSSKSIVRDPNKCVMCRKCEKVCRDVQTCNVLSAVERGFNTYVETAFEMPLKDTNCTFCGQCGAVCPTAAITEKNDTAAVLKAINDPKKHVIVQTAPAVRVALGEEFGMEPGSVVTGKMVALLKSLGFDGVYDTDFAADLTIMEEANEVVDRIVNGGRLPILTSCCPAWVNFIEFNYPDMLDVPSTCKSPQNMFGAMAKTYLAEKINVDPKDMVVVSIMPCVAKKYEASRGEMVNADGLKDVDFVLSTRELGQLGRAAGINFAELDDANFDNPMGDSTGAAVIFGASGGVLEAALRTAYHMVTKEELESVDFNAVRGFEGIKEATISLPDLDLKVAVAHSLGNARKLLDAVRDGSKEYHVIEIMACPGGCINGGGQPYSRGDQSVLDARLEAIYTIDADMEIRKSHLNPQIKAIYDEYLGEPGSHKAHELLHTKYFAKQK